MSLETYIDGQTQAFRKLGAGEVLFGLQNSQNFKLLPIFKAYKSGSSAAVTEITAVKIDSVYPFKELGRVVLPTNLIIFDSVSNQYIIDNTKTITGLLQNAAYYLEFKNGYNIFETEAFKVKEMEIPLTWDLTVITWDSTIITFDQTNYNVPTISNLVDKFDTNFINSIVYSEESGYQIRSAGSQWKFRYSGTYLGIKAKNTIFATFPEYSQISIIIDGTLFQTNQIADENLHVINLPQGNKIVELIEGATSKPTTIIGTFLTSVTVERDKFLKINEGSVSDKLVFLGDSITVGANATEPSIEGFPYRFKYEDSKGLGVLGYGFGKLKDFAETTPKITAVMADIVEMFSNVTTTKKLIIALGTNDFALDATLAATFQGWYEDLLDAINLEDSDIQVFCISPIIRSSDGALLDDYRTAIGVICGARAYATHIVGKTILVVGDLDDGVHPTTAGHQKYKDSIESVILA